MVAGKNEDAGIAFFGPDGYGLRSKGNGGFIVICGAGGRVFRGCLVRVILLAGGNGQKGRRQHQIQEKLFHHSVMVMLNFSVAL